MAGRGQPKLACDDEGFEERIRRADARTVAALKTSLAQDESVLKMGTNLNVNLRFNRATGEQLSPEIVLDLVDKERLGYLAAMLRPFQLSSEAIYFGDVIEGLRRFAGTESKRRLVAQLPRLWEVCRRDRLRTFVAHRKHGELIPGGVGDATVADRVLYSQVVHADDAADILRHISTEWQQWSLAGLVGDWTAMAAHQQYVAHLVRPDLIAELTSWAGDARTIFQRFGFEITTTESD